MEAIMAAFIKTLVNIPVDKGVHSKSAGAKGEKYIDKYVKYFRNKNGEPRNKAIAIGKLDKASGMMYPNSNYFKTYNLEPLLHNISIWDYGYSYIVLKACRDIGLFDCLLEVFGAQAMDIIIMAAYIIREGNAMDGIDDWQQRNYFPQYKRLLTSQSTSKIFAALTHGQRNDFFIHWVKKALSGGTVFYDVTSISSYAQQMTDIERGYNRDGENLPQYNMGIFCNEKTRIPLYYNRYNGSLTDRANLSHVLANAKSVGIKRIKMVVDAGFWSEECLKSLKNACETFTVGMPVFLKESEKIVSGYGEGIDKYANELGRHHVYCVPVQTEIHGICGRVLIYYDPSSHLNHCIELSNHINLLKAELEKVKRYPRGKLSRYSPYFILAKHKQDNGFDFYVNEENVERMRKAKGYFLIFTTDSESTPLEILEHYRAKDANEKLFAQIKVEMDGNRIRTHSMETTEGKTFVAFIASVIRSYLLNCLTKYLNDYSTSMKKIFSQLSNITIISSNDGCRFTKAFTKVQKQILAVLDPDNDIVNSVNDGCIR
jgi:transposase